MCARRCLEPVAATSGITPRAARRLRRESTEQARLTPEIAREFERLLGEQLANTGVPGLSVTVVFPDDQVWSGAAGDAVIEPRQPMTTRTAMAFDSVTKMATAALALRLAERGALALDDPIRRWYPAWRGDRQATVRDLLGHTSGAADPTEERFEAICAIHGATSRGVSWRRHPSPVHARARPCTRTRASSWPG